MMLSTRGIGCPDDMLSPYCAPRRAEEARILDECLCLGLGDAEAWAIFCGDRATETITTSTGKQRVVVAGPLAVFRIVHGNKPRRRTGQKPRSRPRPVRSVPDVPRPGSAPEIAEQGRLL